MKKIISLLLAVSMIVAAGAIAVSAEGASNVTVDAKYMSTQPTFDGVINADEWGEPTFEVKGSEAVQPGAQTPGEHNTLAYFDYELDADGNPIAIDPHINPDEEGNYTKNDEYKNTILNTNYKVWLRWDTKYYYIAVEVEDPDGYYLADGRANIWDGDCVQFRVDPMGPNSYLAYKNPSYDYTKAPFDPAAASAVGHMPWAYPTKTCNIGLGQVTKKNGSVDKQAYDMAETGNMTATQQLNDPKKLGPDSGKTGGVDMASLFDMSVTKNPDGSSTNVYEYAVPWAYLDQWNLGQVAVGYAWGMSLVVLQGNEQTKKYNAYLTWGSGICGAQQDKSELWPTIGGSNAVILSDLDINGNQVADLPQIQEISHDDATENVLDARGIDAAYLGTTNDVTVDPDGFTTAIDVAYIAGHPTDEMATKVGFVVGTGYGMFAGWTGNEKQFVVAKNAWNSGIDRNTPFAASDKVFDWDAENAQEDGSVVGQWHRLMLKCVGNNIKIYFDGELVLDDTDDRNRTVQVDGSRSQLILYNQGDVVFDNWVLASADYDDTTGKASEIIFNYNFNGDDAGYNTSDVKLQAIQMSHEAVPGVCHAADTAEEYWDDGYGCNFKTVKDPETGKLVNKCIYCGAIGEPAVVYGDVNMDGKINVSDATALLKYLANWGNSVDLAAADCNGDGKINVSDVTTLLKYLANWEGVVLGPKA